MIFPNEKALYMTVAGWGRVDRGELVLCPTYRLRESAQSIGGRPRAAFDINARVGDREKSVLPGDDAADVEPHGISKWA